MYCNDDAYKGLPEKEIWTILLLGNYALKKLEGVYDGKNNHTQITTSSFSSDRRRAPTIRKHLISLGLINNSYSFNDNLRLIDDEVEKILGGYSIEPKFNTTGYIEQRKNSYSSDMELTPVTDLSDVYRGIEDLNAYELIHVYLNQGLYDFKIFKTTSIYRNRKSFGDNSYDRYDLKLYPISALEVTDGAALIANSETFAKNHAREILTAAFGCKFKCLSDDKEYMTKDAVSKRLENLEDKLRRLHRARKELLILQRKLDTLGEEALQKKLFSTSFEYIHTQAPLWINNQEDKTKNELAVLICKGSPGLTLEKTLRH